MQLLFIVYLITSVMIARSADGLTCYSMISSDTSISHWGECEGDGCFNFTCISTIGSQESTIMILGCLTVAPSKIGCDETTRDECSKCTRCYCTSSYHCNRSGRRHSIMIPPWFWPVVLSSVARHLLADY